MIFFAVSRKQTENEIVLPFIYLRFVAWLHVVTRVERKIFRFISKNCTSGRENKNVTKIVTLISYLVGLPS